MINIKKTYLKYQRNRKRKRLVSSLKALEEKHQRNNTWHASLKLNCQILSLLDPSLLIACNEDYSRIQLLTGFSSAHHLLHWTQCVITSLRNRERISFDLTNVMYQRKVVTLGNFCVIHETKRYPVNDLHKKLLTELTTIIHLFDDIKDRQYADKSSAALEPLWVDVFAVIEVLCTLGVKHEQ